MSPTFCFSETVFSLCFETGFSYNPRLSLNSLCIPRWLWASSCPPVLTSIESLVWLKAKFSGEAFSYLHFDFSGSDYRIWKGAHVSHRVAGVVSSLVSVVMSNGKELGVWLINLAEHRDLVFWGVCIGVVHSILTCGGQKKLWKFSPFIMWIFFFAVSKRLN